MDTEVVIQVLSMSSSLQSASAEPANPQIVDLESLVYTECNLKSYFNNVEVEVL